METNNDKAAPTVDAAELSKLKALAEAATPGPWIHNKYEYDGRGNRYQPVVNIPERDAKFIAAANPAAILRIAALVAQQAARIEELRLALSDLYGLTVELEWIAPDNRYHIITNAATLIVEGK